MIKQLIICLCVASAIVSYAATPFEAQLKAANDREILRTQADQFWTYVRIGDYGSSNHWIVGTNEMADAAFTKNLATAPNLPASVMLYPDYDIANDEQLLARTELLLWRSGIKTIRLYNPSNGTWAVKDSPSKEELDFYWEALKHMDNGSQQAGPGYPPQGVGSPDP